MHRVYNSAFMHMLRDEKNAQYQQVIRETVAFDARILGRYVNFMSNPDERTAIDQFGSHDKYFGVATMLATLPGLPMFGHGQVEGFSERYGMEFRRPQRDEWPDEGLLERHRREIFPLLRQRWRFAGAAGFRQLAAFVGAAEVADVFAYANHAHSGPPDAGERRSLVVYLNRYPRAHVRIADVAEALDLGDDPEGYLILHEARSGLQYLRQLRDLRDHGLELSMDGYACQVFLGFEEVSDAGGQGWAELAMRLGLGGVHDVHAALRHLREEPWREAVAALFGSPAVELAFVSPTTDLAVDMTGTSEAAGTSATAGGERPHALERLAALAGMGGDAAAAREMPGHLSRARAVRPRLLAQAVAGWAVSDAVGRVACGGDPLRTEAAFDDWGASAAIGELSRRSGATDSQAWRVVELARALVGIERGSLMKVAAGPGLPSAWFSSAGVRTASGWHEWQGVGYVGQEPWDELVDAVAARDLILGEPGGPAAAMKLKRRAAAMGYRVDQAVTGRLDPAAPEA
jgi:hypothetical protein